MRAHTHGRTYADTHVYMHAHTHACTHAHVPGVERVDEPNVLSNLWSVSLCIAVEEKQREKQVFLLRRWLSRGTYSKANSWGES